MEQDTLYLAWQEDVFEQKSSILWVMAMMKSSFQEFHCTQMKLITQCRLSALNSLCWYHITWPYQGHRDKHSNRQECTCREMYLPMVICMLVCLDVVIQMASTYLLIRENLYMLPICCMNRNPTQKMWYTLKCLGKLSSLERDLQTSALLKCFSHANFVIWVSFYPKLSIVWTPGLTIYLALFENMA